MVKRWRKDLNRPYFLPTRWFKMSTEEEYKITVSLSRKGLTTLDMLKETSGFGSRGRTIEEAILTINELTEQSKSLFSQYIADMQSKGKVGDGTAFGIIGWFVVVISKISRFISIPTPPTNLQLYKTAKNDR